MSLESVFKNLYKFFEILKESTSEHVSCWNKQSINNAFHWALYAEQIFQKSEGKPYRQQLDCEIRKIGQLPWALGNCDIKLDLLEHSQKLLRHNLLQNHHIKKDLVLSVLLDDTGKCRLLAEDYGDLISTKNFASVLLTAVERSAGIHDLGERAVPSSSEILLQSEARLLLHYLNVSRCPVDLTAPFSQRLDPLSDVIKAYSSSSHGVTVIANALVIVSLHGAVEVSQEIADMLLSIISDILDTNERVVWHLPSSTLVDLCRCHSFVHIRYLEYIKRCGRHLQADYDNVYFGRRGIRLSWRCDPNEESLSYEDVKSRIMELINYDSLLAVATKKAIIRLTECTLAVPNVWTDLMEDLEISGVG